MLPIVAPILAAAGIILLIDDPAIRAALLIIIALFAVCVWFVHGHNRLDSYLAARRRRRARFWLMTFMSIGGGCRPDATVSPEPIAALAEVDTLDCGGRSCAVTEVAGSTLITVTE